MPFLLGLCTYHFVRLRRIFTKILDMTQHMASTILTNKVAKVRPQTHVPTPSQHASPHTLSQYTYAVADFCKPHSCTGTPLNKMNPLPSKISVFTARKKDSNFGKGKRSCKA